jgi:hypothetical protein
MGARWYYIISTLHANLSQDQPTTNSTQHRPSSEANSCSVSQEIPKVLQNPHVHHHMHKPITGPYAEPDESHPHAAVIFLEELFTTIFIEI